jgi:hypothetical protein
MAKSNLHAGDVLSLVLNGVALPAAYGSTLYVRAHTADPGLTGDGTVNECTYTGYAAVAVTRDNTGAGFTTTGTTRSNAGELTLPQCTGVADDQTITHLTLNTAATGAGRVIGKGALAQGLRVTNLITPRLLAGALTYQEA